MKSKNVVIGMKVVPHSKSNSLYQSVEGLEGSVVWYRAKLGNQPFLYVHAWDKDTRAFVLSELPYNPGYETGDYFLAREFEPYVEEQ